MKAAPRLIEAGKLKHLVRIEERVPDESFDGGGSGSWGLVATVAADIQDMLPSRGERLADGLNIATRPARVRIWRRDDITAAMRIVRGAIVDGEDVDYGTARIMQIIAGPAEIDDGRGMEFMVEDYSVAGNGA